MSAAKPFAVRPIINALGTFTRVGGSLMPAEVLDSIREAAGHFVCLEELQAAAGREIARLLQAEAAYVTSGAQSALVLSVAACLTRLDAAAMDRLPRTDDRPNEVLMARFHRNHYDHAIEAAGGTIVTVGSEEDCSPEDYVAAINDQTVAILYLPWREDRLSFADVLEVARRHSIPLLVDAAGACDDPRNLTRFSSAGANLVCHSGGKHIRGPQSSGIVCGDRDLISAIAWQHLDMDFTPEVWTAPPELLSADQLKFVPRQGIGRGYKAGKEEIHGLVTALRLYFERDHSAEKREARRKLDAIAFQLSDVPEISTSLTLPATPDSGFPTLTITIDSKRTGLTGIDFIRALKAGTPSIHPGERKLAEHAVVIHPFNLQLGDETAIAARIREIVLESRRSRND